MKKLITSGIAVTALGLPTLAAAQDAVSFDQKVNDVFASSTGWFAPLPGTAFPWIVMWLVVAATIFTFDFGFIQLKAFGHAISLVKGDYSDPNDAGEVSQFQALLVWVISRVLLLLSASGGRGLRSG